MTRPGAVGALARLSPLLLAASCCLAPPFGPPSPATVAQVRPMPLAGQIGETFVFELDAPQLAGVFDAVWAHSADGVQVQLFPDVGGKVLEVAARGGQLTAETPDGVYSAELSRGDPAPHLGLLVAAVMAELGAPVTPDRVLGERRAADGATELQLQPALGCGSVRAALGAGGAVSSYAFELGRLRFRLDGTGRIDGSGLSGQVCP